MAEEKFKPFIPSEKILPEFTFWAVFWGALLGLIFAANTVYLGLKVGLTVSASIPVAVLSLALAKSLRPKTTILENNIVQMVGSAGESIAAGVIFTLPALIFLGFDLQISKVFLVALTGSWIGILLMVPLRNYLIEKEHGNLKYPEGTACAQVLIGGEKGGTHANLVFSGLGLGMLYKVLMAVFHFWKDIPQWNLWKEVGGKIKGYYGALVNGEISPELLGVGYIIGPRISAVMVSGGIMAWLFMIPFIKIFGESLPEPFFPGIYRIKDMTPHQIWGSYVRYIGAGAVAMGGIINLIRALPTIIDSFKSSIRDISKSGKLELISRIRISKDMPFTFVIFGSLILIVALIIINYSLVMPSVSVSILSALLMGLFGFFFVTVSARIVGMIGSSSNPISGMTIATLMMTALIFIAVGWVGHGYTSIAMNVGAIVCIAAAIGGATSQSLKTTYIVGGTPYKNEWGMMIGAMTSVLAIGWTLYLVNWGFTSFKKTEFPGVTISQQELVMLKQHEGPDKNLYYVKSYIGDHKIPDGKYLIDKEGNFQYQWIDGVGSEKLAAPQARLMSIVVNGLLQQKLPWGLVLLGVIIAISVYLLGINPLPFAVGAYLPLSISTPIFCGGLINAIISKIAGKKEGEEEAGRGVIFASGLIAGGALTGIIIAAITGAGWDKTLAFGPGLIGKISQNNYFALMFFLIMTYILFTVARKKD
ncbi:MAG: oligopeptide transporter, OPT family [Acidobacteriota bacterium]